MACFLEVSVGIRICHGVYQSAKFIDFWDKLTAFRRFFFGLCVLFGQLIVQFPERAYKGRPPEGTNYVNRVKVWILSSPNRLGAYIMSVGNAVFVVYALSPLEYFRLFSGIWNILLNTYLMARASKRLKSDSKDSL